MKKIRRRKREEGERKKRELATARTRVFCGRRVL